MSITAKMKFAARFLFAETVCERFSLTMKTTATAVAAMAAQCESPNRTNSRSSMAGRPGQGTIVTFNRR